jgi:esterase/lipase superfamily enzyme
VATLAFAFGQAQARCDVTAAEPLEIVKARYQLLEAQIEALPDSERNSGQHRDLQERALEELEKLQCAQEERAPAEEVKRGPSTETAFVRVPLLFITDRKHISEPENGHRYFSASLAPSGVTFGSISVTLPAERFDESRPVPIGMEIIKIKDTSAGVTLATPDELTSEDLAQKIVSYKASLPPKTKSRLLLFVHGYNVTFADAAQAAVRLAYGLRIELLPIAISWPSQGETLSYWQDEQSVETSIERFRPIFQMLLTAPEVDEVILVGHSMGTRLVTRVLSQLDLQKAKLDKLSRIVFAAADLGEEELRELWPRIMPLGQNGWTIYTSANDIALMASRIIHGFPRVGDSKKRVFQIEKAETIDASAVAPFMRGYGHSYVIDNSFLQEDLRRWIIQGSSASERGLLAGNRPPAVFWELPK